MTIAVRLRIEGRVQGVGYRDWLMREARRHGVRGWVRNRRDGSVEAQFAGPADKVDDMVAACRRGPPHARVDGIIAAPVDDDGAPGFRSLPTV